MCFVIFCEEGLIMKKNLKIVSLAAAALLAVSPIVASVSTVNATPKTAKETKKPAAKKITTINASDVKADQTPYFTEGNQSVSSGSINLTKANTVDEIVSQIMAKYNVNVNDNTEVAWDKAALTQSVENGLKNASIAVNNGTFAFPANSFTINVVFNYGSLSSVKSITLPVTVNAYNAPADYSANPIITYNGKKYDHDQNIELADNAAFNYVKVNGTVDTAAIQKAFTAHLSSKDNNTVAVTVDASKVNTAVAGKYLVTVTAVNPGGKKTILTFQLTVGEKGATYKTVNTASPVYSINGNAVSQTSNNVAAGTSVATFGAPVTVNGVSYTRINGANADQFVLTSAFDQVAKNNTDETTTVTSDVIIMHSAAAYTKDGKRAKKTFKTYANVSVEGKAVTINGAKYYKIAGTDYYVKATNISGTKRTLKRRSYIYKSSKRRANRKVLKKGAKVTTYGGSIKFKNGKRYYRINKGQYVRTSNFR